MIKKGTKVKFTISQTRQQKGLRINFTGVVKEVKREFSDVVIEKDSIRCLDDITKRKVEKF